MRTLKDADGTLLEKTEDTYGADGNITYSVQYQKADADSDDWTSFERQTTYHTDGTTYVEEHHIDKEGNTHIERYNHEFIDNDEKWTYLGENDRVVRIQYDHVENETRITTVTNYDKQERKSSEYQSHQDPETNNWINVSKEYVYNDDGTYVYKQTTSEDNKPDYVCWYDSNGQPIADPTASSDDNGNNDGDDQSGNDGGTEGQQQPVGLMMAAPRSLMMGLNVNSVEDTPKPDENQSNDTGSSDGQSGNIDSSDDQGNGTDSSDGRSTDSNSGKGSENNVPAQSPNPEQTNPAPTQE